MNDAWRQILERRDELSAIPDQPLDDIRDRMKTAVVKALRSAIDEIGHLPSDDRLDREVRRRSEIEWLNTIIGVMQPSDQA